MKIVIEAKMIFHVGVNVLSTDVLNSFDVKDPANACDQYRFTIN